MVAGRRIASVDAYGLTLAKFNGKNMTPADVNTSSSPARRAWGNRHREAEGQEGFA